MEWRRKRATHWALWTILTIGAGLYLTCALITDDAAGPGAVAWGKQFFLPGETTHGHHQIELACGACHTDPFGGDESIQEACVECHGAELEAADDSHPTQLFADPRNFEMLEKVDATYCAACHVEHKPELTHAMGVTIPPDNCMVCHRDIAEERPTHTGMNPNSCAAAGCHNYHDNRALYEDFLLEHLREPDVLDTARVPTRNFAELAGRVPSYPDEEYPLRALSRTDQDGGNHATPKLIDAWATSAHAESGVNCDACHQSNDAWVDHPDNRVCGACHDEELRGWLAGMHGMRVAQKLSPMTPAMAEIPMKHHALDKRLSCNSCHAAHRFNVQGAGAHDCLRCHNDQHSLAYRGSPHHRLWRRETAGRAPRGSGVSCATCHLPRVSFEMDDIERVLVQHNQNDNLRPNSKMLRTVCMNCHGLGFALDALADRKLIESNFTGKPAKHVKSLDMAARTRERTRSRQTNSSAGANAR